MSSCIAQDSCFMPIVRIVCASRMYHTELDPFVTNITFFKFFISGPWHELHDTTKDYPVVYQAFATINRVPYFHSLALNSDAFARSAGGSSGSRLGLVRRWARAVICPPAAYHSQRARGSFWAGGLSRTWSISSCAATFWPQPRTTQ